MRGQPEAPQQLQTLGKPHLGYKGGLVRVNPGSDVMARASKESRR